MAEEAHFREEMWPTHTCSVLGRGGSIQRAGPAPVSEPEAAGDTDTSLCCCGRLLSKGRVQPAPRLSVLVVAQALGPAQAQAERPGCSIIWGPWG